MKRKSIFFLWSIIILMQIACAKETSVPVQEESSSRVSEPGHFGNDSTYTEPTIRILFVGNSLTYTNNLPAMVQAIGVNNDIQIETEMLAYPNYALEDHWRDGKFQKLMNEKYFNYVIIQQGPSSQQDGRYMLFDYGDRFKIICDEKGARLVFFMVWPSRANYQTFAGVIQNYRDASVKTESMLCPVGEAWKSYIDSTLDFTYYDVDGFHPSIKGSQIAAQLIYNTLFSN
jgi:hypothetical protein